MTIGPAEPRSAPAALAPINNQRVFAWVVLRF